MNKKYIVAWEEEDEGCPEQFYCAIKSYAEALKRANLQVDRGCTDVKVCEVKAEVVVTKRFVEY